MLGYQTIIITECLTDSLTPSVQPWIFPYNGASPNTQYFIQDTHMHFIFALFCSLFLSVSYLLVGTVF